MDKYETGIQEMGINLTEQKLSNEPYQIARFDSCWDMITKLQKGFKDYDWNGKGEGIVEGCINDEPEWTFGQLKDYDTTLKYLTEGLVLETVLKKATQVQNQLMSQPAIENLVTKAATFKRRRQFSETGAELCIDRVLCGDPEHWALMTKGKKNTLIKLGVNIAGNSGENEELFNKLVAVTGVVADLLNRAGFAVEVSSCTSLRGATSHGGKASVITVLKKAEEAMDLQRIYSVGCSGYFRCWCFHVFCNILKGKPYHSLGSSQGVTKEMKEALGFDYVIDSEFVAGVSQEVKIEGLFEEVIRNNISN